MALVTAVQVVAVALPEVTRSPLDATVEADLLAFAARADAALARHCGYPVASSATGHTLESATYAYRTENSSEDYRTLSLPWSGGRITSITSINDDPERDWPAGTVVASGDYTLLAEEGEVLLTSSSTHGAWGTVKGSIVATVVAGWTSITVPDEVVQAICLLAGHYWRLRAEHGHTSVSAGQGSVGVRDETIPDSVKELVSGWRLIRWPL